MLAGKNVAPCFHFSAFIVSIIHIGNEGSNIAIPILANVMAPDFEEKNGVKISNEVRRCLDTYLQLL